MTALAGHLDTPITLPGGRQVRCADAAAAVGYTQLQADLKRHGRTPNPHRAADVISR